MCSYCGTRLNGDSIELMIENNIIHLCNEECAIFYLQEQQQRHFQSWVKIR